MCRRSRPLTVVVSPEQPVTLRCQVEANPDVVSFGWTLSNDRETLRIQRELSIDSGLTSILEYTPRRDTEFGRLKCWARNDIGEQKDPCVFIIVKEGKVARVTFNIYLSSSSSFFSSCCVGFTSAWMY